MKHLIIILFIIFFKFNLSVIAQCINGGCGVQLLPNPGFEIAGTPTISGSIVMPLTPGPVQGWVGTDNSGALSTPDYHNLHGVVPAPNSANANNYACTSGNGMVGFFTRAAGSGNGREYVQAQLISPLVAGQQYCFSMVVKSRQTASPPAPPNNVLTQCDGVGVWSCKRHYILCPICRKITTCWSLNLWSCSSTIIIYTRRTCRCKVTAYTVNSKFESG